MAADPGSQPGNSRCPLPGSHLLGSVCSWANNVWEAMETLWVYSPRWIHAGFAQTLHCLRALPATTGREGALVRPLPVGTRAEQDPPSTLSFSGARRAHCLHLKAPLPPLASSLPTLSSTDVHPLQQICTPNAVLGSIFFCRTGAKHRVTAHLCAPAAPHPALPLPPLSSPPLHPRVGPGRPVGRTHLTLFTPSAIA